MKIIKILINKKQKIFKYCFWLKQARKIKRKLLRRNGHQLSFNKEDRIIVLVPHSDDEWVGCSTILKMMKHQVYCCYMGYGEVRNSTTLTPKRKLEMQKMLNRYDVNFIDISTNPSKLLEDAINEIRPDFIFVPNFIDWHIEHLETINYLYSTLKKINNSSILATVKIAMYQISVPMKLEQITHYCTLSRVDLFSKWINFWKVYKTQRHLPIVRFLLNEYINGGIFNCFSAEIFSIFPYSHWNEEFENIDVDIMKNSDIKNYIDDLEKIRNIL